jgi:hypothetical protein
MGLFTFTFYYYLLKNIKDEAPQYAATPNCLLYLLWPKNYLRLTLPQIIIIIIITQIKGTSVPLNVKKSHGECIKQIPQFELDGGECSSLRLQSN